MNMAFRCIIFWNRPPKGGAALAKGAALFVFMEKSVNILGRGLQYIYRYIDLACNLVVVHLRYFAVGEVVFSEAYQVRWK
jgi:hypothetical protein